MPTSQRASKDDPSIIRPSLGNLFLLLEPGLGLKRWLILAALGVFVLALGISYLMRYYELTTRLPISGSVSIYIIIAITGLLFIIIGSWKLAKSIFHILTIGPRTQNIAQAIYNYHHLERGPRVVAIGGGTGLSTILRGLKEYTSNLTAIVTVADDGGSSGRLRRELGILPPGDIRNCLVALSEAEPLVTRLFQYRFSQGSGLDGHSFGNLFIVAMSGVTGGFAEAVHESSRVLAVRGEILPATLDNITLTAQMENNSTVTGETSISNTTSRIRTLSIDPPDALAHPSAVEAILDAQIILLGPGSLYTSIIPNLAVPGIRDALYASKALKIYVCNVAIQRGETEGYSASDHLEALLRHTNGELVDLMLVNTAPPPASNNHTDYTFVNPGTETMIHNIRVVGFDLVNESIPIHHDPIKLARTVFGVYHSKQYAKKKITRLT
jgi:uncharacterized cofD-like protein